MKMTTILKKLILVAVMIVFSAGMASAQTVRVGIAAEPYPPFTVPDASGNWSGWEVDIIMAICEEATFDCVITPTAWDGIIPALMSKKIDLIMNSMSITAERMKSIDFSDKYYNTPTVVIGTKRAKFDATPEGLKGKYLGVQTATIHKVYAEKYFTEAKIKEYQTQDEINQDLVVRTSLTRPRRIPWRLPISSKQMKARPAASLRERLQTTRSFSGSGVGAGIRKGDDALKSKINAAIAAIRANGKYDEISKKYFDFDIYGE